MQFTPSDALKPFVKSYSIITLDSDLNDEVFYPSGYVDLAINLTGNAATSINGHERTMPNTEILGQLTVPTRLTVAKGTSVLLARFYPWANSLFFNKPVSEFTNYAIDSQNIFTDESHSFHDAIVHTPAAQEKIQTVDDFLLRHLRRNEKLLRKTKTMEQLCSSVLKQGEHFDIKTTAKYFGISERYIQRLFLETIGVTPRSFYNIQRFNKSVEQVLSTSISLTTIAYNCGYYDQAHFIREFKKFTGITPSEARPELAEGGLKFQQAVNIGL